MSNFRFSDRAVRKQCCELVRSLCRTSAKAWRENVALRGNFIRSKWNCSTRNFTDRLAEVNITDLDEARPQLVFAHFVRALRSASNPSDSPNCPSSSTAHFMFPLRRSARFGALFLIKLSGSNSSVGVSAGAALLALLALLASVAPATAHAPIVIEGNVRGPQLVLGSFQACANLRDGGFTCWGKNEGNSASQGSGLLGLPHLAADAVINPPSTDHVDFGVGRTVKFIANSCGSHFHTCVILDNGQLACWGSNYYGQLGIGSTTSVTEPQIVTENLEGRTVLNAATCSDTTCAILDGGELRCWGRNGNYAFGDGSSTSATRSTPPSLGVDLGIGRKAVSVALGVLHTCVLLDDGSVKCWGKNDKGQLGDGTTTTRSTPAAPINTPAGSTAKAIASGRKFSCAIMNDDKLYCWGENTPLSKTEDVPTPEQFFVGETFKSVACADVHALAVRSDGVVYSFGSDSYGRLGRAATSQTVNLGSNEVAETVVANSLRSCATLEGGEVKCWGNGVNGMLGYGDEDNRGVDGVGMGDNLPYVRNTDNVPLYVRKMSISKCDASTPPANGAVGDCVADLSPETTCDPTCDAGFKSSGGTTCDYHGQVVHTTSCMTKCDWCEWRKAKRGFDGHIP